MTWSELLDHLAALHGITAGWDGLNWPAWTAHDASHEQRGWPHAHAPEPHAHAYRHAGKVVMPNA